MSEEEVKAKPETKTKQARRRKKKSPGLGEDVANVAAEGCLWGCIMLPIQLVLEVIFDSRR
jgi:hypothetical protein